MKQSLFPLLLIVSLPTVAATVLSSPLVGQVSVDGSLGDWEISSCRESLGEGLEKIILGIRALKPTSPPRFRVSFTYPLRDCVGHWRTGAGFGKYITQDWRGEARWSSSLASQGPVVAFYDSGSSNRLLVACSESLRKVAFRTGVTEEDSGRLVYQAEFFTEPEAPMTEYAVDFLVDMRALFYAEAIRSAFDWCVSELGDDPKRPVAAAAFDPLYSFWYSYHQNVSAESVERECSEVAKFGLKTVIVDDGWQTDDSSGGYSFCGDWRVSAKKFPDFAAHVANVRKTGLKYMLWYAVPFVGTNSENFARFRGKCLFHNGGLGASVLDPRFPEVRRHLAGVYERALTEWKLDGLKLDFIDHFHFEGPDPAVRENYAGRDIRSLPLAVDALMTEISARCRAIKPDVLVEFRQEYVGPAIRRYGNMMRVGDCAYGVAQNRTGSLDLRLSSGPLAVHSDMIVWDPQVHAETAAQQFLNVMFCVPQISVRLAELPESHRQMLQRWLGFWSAHRETLLFGELRPMRPDLNYPIVYAFGKGEQVVAVYDGDQVVRLDEARGKAYIVNATPSHSLVIERGGELRRIPVAPSSVLELP